MYLINELCLQYYIYDIFYCYNFKIKMKFIIYTRNKKNKHVN